jgi:AraC family transcriptional regulator of adaptative response/methylated-DNA-[protein]-cysteine methyltransferase
MYAIAPAISQVEASFASDDDKWAAVLRSDPAADGVFVLSVRSTGIYCRPTCGARTPLRRNVRFHPNPADAERAGFRPCKRCRPNEASPAERRAIAIAAACRMIESAETPPSLAQIAAAVAMSPHNFHRVFRAATGVTPRAYAAARRDQRLRAELGRAGSVTEAIYGAGFGSSGRFYEASGNMLGMTPRAFRAGGAGAAIRFAVGECSLGAILVAASETGICAIELGDDPEALARGLQDRFPAASLVGDDSEFAALVARVVGIVDGGETASELPLDIRGTAFQRRVWQALTEIPAGGVVSYTEIAARIGNPKATRAVAGACAANPLAVAIPCHRVVRRDGNPAGYRWGVERKLTLLAREAAAAGFGAGAGTRRDVA